MDQLAQENLGTSKSLQTPFNVIDKREFNDARAVTIFEIMNCNPYEIS